MIGISILISQNRETERLVFCIEPRKQQIGLLQAPLALLNKLQPMTFLLDKVLLLKREQYKPFRTLGIYHT